MEKKIVFKRQDVISLSRKQQVSYLLDLMIKEEKVGGVV